MLKLCDIIKLCGVNLGRFKIHLATSNSHPPLQAYHEGKFQAWQEDQNQKNFQCETILSLIALGHDQWLFVGVWKVLGVEPAGNRFKYNTQEIQGLESLSGKAIIYFKRLFRASYLIGANYGDKLLISEVLRERHSIPDFPGFSRVRLEFSQLTYIVSREIPSWKSALCSIAGVYAISDRASGRIYVGSAYNTEGIWGRWRLYSQAPHGFNKELINLLTKEGDVYSKNFRFSILEICDILSSKDEVIRRESHWKESLLTRKYGYNSN